MYNTGTTCIVVLLRLSPIADSEKAGIEEEDDEYAWPSSLQYDDFHDGGRGG